MFKKIISKLSFSSSKTNTIKNVDVCKEDLTAHEGKSE
jgi:hypothetical protein